MSTKEKKPSLGLIWIMLFLSIAIIAYGFYLKGRRDSFLKTDGTFERYSDYIETDDDGYKEVKYRWYYSYNVNGTDYELSSSGNLSPHGPKYDVVLYNPEDPSESILENDKSVFVITLFGSILLGASLLAAFITKWNPMKKDERLFDESQISKGEVESDRPPDDEPIIMH